MTRRALFRDDGTGAIDDGDGNTVNGVPDPTSESDVLTVVSGVWAGAAPSGGGGGSGGIGASELIYRYTVTGSDKVSIDTGADTADAGSNDWSGGDLLEIYVLASTDDTGVTAQLKATLNNDGSSVYDREEFYGAGTTVGADAVKIGTAYWQLSVNGSGGSGSYAGMVRLVLPGYAGTHFWKTAEIASSNPDGSSSIQIVEYSAGYRSTSAIARLAVTPETAGKKLKVGSQLLIYKRLAS